MVVTPTADWGPRLPEPHARATAAVIDELDAGRLERAPDGLIVGRGHLGFAAESPAWPNRSVAERIQDRSN